jgi:hypothetical protein
MVATSAPRVLARPPRSQPAHSSTARSSSSRDECLTAILQAACLTAELPAIAFSVSATTASLAVSAAAVAVAAQMSQFDGGAALPAATVAAGLPAERPCSDRRGPVRAQRRSDAARRVPASLVQRHAAGRTASSQVRSVS